VKTARSVCYDILREMLREARQFNPKEFRVVASAAVVEMLLDEESQHLAACLSSSASRSRCRPSRR
jgi:ribonuclease G